jgi:hypothetical protein
MWSHPYRVVLPSSHTSGIEPQILRAIPVSWPRSEQIMKIFAHYPSDAEKVTSSDCPTGVYTTLIEALYISGFGHKVKTPQ